MDFSKVFDPYKYGARVKPALLLVLPIVIYVMAFLKQLVRGVGYFHPSW